MDAIVWCGWEGSSAAERPVRCIPPPLFLFLLPVSVSVHCACANANAIFYSFFQIQVALL